MPEPNVSLDFSPSKVDAFRFNEVNLTINVSMEEDKPYWCECVVEAPSPLSLAPDKELATAKTIIGIVGNGRRREKRIKIFAGNNVYPDIYKVKITVYLYDEEGVIYVRKDATKEIECSGNDGKLLQNI